MAKKKRSVKKRAERPEETSASRAEGFADEIFADMNEEYKIDREDLLDEEDSHPEAESAPEPKAAEQTPAEESPAAEPVAEETPAEPKIDEKDLPPDDAKAIEALTRLKCRLDRNDYGNVWRVFMYEHHGTDASLLLLSGLPSLRELWVLGTKVTAKGIEELRVEMPKLTIYS
ncbi:prolipoprotein diacylglyceryl transferase [Lignipirellula cremea]|uniref:Leucine Rich repeats (2 copies) n=1 Tax=Lignipirellula cremea TaxID=2528010 RepID=A0A518DRU3_9BACT|nr:hypothetical protein [Lignipirellula cremea]QDU94560.1 hypothetical protein Pla8534_23520 [Lignipirellula cremea]